MRTILAITFAAFAFCGCINSSTSIAFKSNTYISTPEIQQGGTITQTPTSGAQRVDATTDIAADVPIN